MEEDGGLTTCRQLRVTQLLEQKTEEAEEVCACLSMRQMEQQQEWGDSSRRPRLERSEQCTLLSMGDWQKRRDSEA